MNQFFFSTPFHSTNPSTKFLVTKPYSFFPPPHIFVLFPFTHPHILTHTFPPTHTFSPTYPHPPTHTPKSSFSSILHRLFIVVNLGETESETSDVTQSYDYDIATSATVAFTTNATQGPYFAGSDINLRALEPLPAGYGLLARWRYVRPLK